MTKNLDYSEDVNNSSIEEELTVLTNGGLLLFDRKGRLTFLTLSVNVNNNYTSITLYLKYVNNIPGVCVNMNKSIEKSMNVILSDGTVFKFKEYILGLYYHNMESSYDQNSAKTNATIPPYSLLSTLTQNKQLYMHAGIEGADRARRYQGLLVRPLKSAFNTYVNNNLLLKCNITMDDKKIAQDIYGKATPILQDKTMRKGVAFPYMS